MAVDLHNHGVASICRICLKSSELAMKIIFDSELGEQINICAGVKLVHHNKLPNQICLKCQQLLQSSLEFRTVCQTSQELLTKTFQTQQTEVNVASVEKSELCQIIQINKSAKGIPACNEHFDELLNEDQPELASILSSPKTSKNKALLIPNNKQTKRLSRSQPYECLICNIAKFSTRSLKRHMKTHVIENIIGNKLSSYQKKHIAKRRVPINYEYSTQQPIEKTLCNMKKNSKAGARLPLPGELEVNMTEEKEPGSDSFCFTNDVLNAIEFCDKKTYNVDKNDTLACAVDDRVHNNESSNQTKEFFKRNKRLKNYSLSRKFDEIQKINDLNEPLSFESSSIETVKVKMEPELNIIEESDLFSFTNDVMNAIAEDSNDDVKASGEYQRHTSHKVDDTYVKGMGVQSIEIKVEPDLKMFAEE